MIPEVFRIAESIDCTSGSKKSMSTGVIPTLSVIAMPADTNVHGKIFGGWLMAHMDLSAAQKAIESTRQDIVTRVANISFHKPVDVGDKVSLYTEVARVGETSITVKVEAVALRRITGENEKVGEGEFVFVAIDKNKNKTKIRQVQ